MTSRILFRLSSMAFVYILFFQVCPSAKQAAFFGLWYAHQIKLYVIAAFDFQLLMNRINRKEKEKQGFNTLHNLNKL